MNNEWNSEVVTEVPESDITVDQSYDATSSNPQSGTAVAEAVAQAGGTVDQTYNASSTNAQSGTAVAEAISGVKQVPASTASDENKVLAVNAQGTPEWATPSSGGGGDVVVIPLAAAPTGAAIETLFNQVDTAVTANKQVIIKTTNSSNKVRHFALTNTNNLSTNGKFYHFNCIEMVDNLPDIDAIDHLMVVSYTNLGSDPQYNFTVSNYTIATGMSGNSFDPFSA